MLARKDTMCIALGRCGSSAIGLEVELVLLDVVQFDVVQFDICYASKVYVARCTGTQSAGKRGHGRDSPTLLLGNERL